MSRFDKLYKEVTDELEAMRQHASPEEMSQLVQKVLIVRWFRSHYRTLRFVRFLAFTCSLFSVIEIFRGHWLLYVYYTILSFIHYRVLVSAHKKMEIFIKKYSKEKYAT